MIGTLSFATSCHSVNCWLPGSHPAGLQHAGRRDNKYKARIKILVKALTPAVFAEKVEAEFARSRIAIWLFPMPRFQRLAGFFTRQPYETLTDMPAALQAALAANPAFGRGTTQYPCPQAARLPDCDPVAQAHRHCSRRH
jgi:hypothetical protein